MKYLRKIQIYLTVILMIASVSCKKVGEYNLQDSPPLDFRSYYNGLTVTFANATAGATNISWEFGDGSSVVTGDSVEHTYDAIGKYIITMNGSLNGKSYIFHTVLRVDKASVVNLEDGSFADWAGVTYPDFILTGKGAVTNAKIDYDANYIYVYVEFDSLDVNAGIVDHIFGVYMDVDNSVATGFSMKEMGVDYACEGNLWNGGWFAPSKVDLVVGDPGWPFVGFDNENAIKPGYITKEGNTIKMEFGISREVFKINSDAMSFSMSIMNSDWSDVGNVVTPLPDFSEKIPVLMNKSSR
jgi:PKD repeat protein